MASKLAYLTLAVAILVAVALRPAAAGGDDDDDDDHHNDNVYDCLAKFGPGCTECINITVTHNPHRRLLSGYATARQLRSDGDHHHNDDDGDHNTGVNRTILVCAQCDAGYRLDPEDDFVLEGGVVVGECECAAGWGVVYDPLTNPKKDDDGIFTCVDCSATGQVPLRKGSGVVQIWMNNAWVLAPAGTKGTRLPRRPPPKTYYEGQCVDCPSGYVPNTNSTACVLL